MKHLGVSSFVGLVDTMKPPWNTQHLWVPRLRDPRTENTRQNCDRRAQRGWVCPDSGAPESEVPLLGVILINDNNDSNNKPPILDGWNHLESHP